jgi:DNA-binding MarR family transcriptional regulator
MAAKLCPNVRRIWTALLGVERGLLVPVRTALKERGIGSVEEAEALLALESAPDHRLRPYELEKALGRPQYATSRLTDRLTQGGFALRESCPTDGRGHHVRLTEAGVAAAGTVREVYSDVLMRAIGQRLGPERVPEIATALERLTPVE